MDKTIKINLAGAIFQISEDGFEILRDYLQTITNRLKNVPGGGEMIEDIESRIGEIFQTGPSWKTGVISREDVEEMIKTMGSAEEIAGDMEGDYNYEKRNSERRLYRDPEKAIIGGVCSGLGNYLRIDPVWIRILFILFTVAFLSGLFIYIVLWVALPVPTTPFQRRQAYREPVGPQSSNKQAVASGISSGGNFYEANEPHPVRKVGNAFNEVFRAFGKFFIIIFRIILALIGVSFIVTGFSLLFSFIIIAFFNSTSILGNVFDTDVFHLPDFLAFIINPSLTPWLMVLSTIVIVLPLAGIIYWGIRMVFQFRAKDLILNIVMFLIWIASCTALSLLLFSEGVSFSNTGRTYEQIALPENDTIYVRMENSINSIEYDKAVNLPFEQFSLYLNEAEKKIYGTPKIDIYPLDEKAPYIQIVRYSSGNTRADARQKAENLIYNYRLDGNTIYLDEFFAIPEGNRWSGANLKVRIYLPAGKVIFVEESLEDIMDDYLGNGVYSYEVGDNYWKVTEDGLEEIR